MELCSIPIASVPSLSTSLTGCSLDNTCFETCNMASRTGLTSDEKIPIVINFNSGPSIGPGVKTLPGTAIFPVAYSNKLDSLILVLNQQNNVTNREVSAP